MQTFKTFLCFIFFIAIAYSCEPEELPTDLSTTSANEIDPNDTTGTNTGDSGDSGENGDDEEEIDDGHGG